MYWPNKCGFVETSDASETLKTKLVTGHETHAILPIAINGNVNAEAYDRCHQYHYIEFYDTIIQTLRLTRVLAFT